MTRPTTTIISTDLCTSCGLCCNGVLFDRVTVTGEEQAEVRRSGLDLQQEDDVTFFWQPCPMFVSHRCAIYENRPVKCRAFRCALLIKVEAGHTSYEDAVPVVEEAKRLVESVHNLQQGPAVTGSANRQWTVLFRQWQAKEPVLRREVADAQLVLHLAVLNSFLDRHFREPEDGDSKAK